jgi:hypothetical protein
MERAAKCDRRRTDNVGKALKQPPGRWPRPEPNKKALGK